MTTILLVDDDPLQLKLNAIHLGHAGYDVALASNAREAITVARTRTPDLIVSDVLMGEIDGFGLCRRVRDDAMLAEIPILLLSAHYDGDSDRLLASDVGAVGLVQRTPDFLAELGWIRMCLDHHQHTRLPTDHSQASYEQHLQSNAKQLARLLGQSRAAELRLRHLLDNANDAISVVGLDGIVIEANRAWETILGLPVREIVGRHVREFAAPGHGAHNAASVTDGHSTVQLVHAKTGAIVHVEFSSSRVELEGREVMFRIGRDVTARVTAERKLAATEAMYRSVVERIPDVIWRLEADGKLAFATPNIEAVTGLSAEAFNAEALARVHLEDRVAVQAMFQRLDTVFEPQDLQFRFEHADGRWIWLHIRAVRRVEAGGRVVVDGITSDVTARRRLEDSFAHAQRMEAIGRLSGGIAHDFNNLLAVIMSNACFLLDDLAENDPRRHDADDIRIAAERAAGLTRQLLAFSRRQVLELRALDINVVVNDLSRMLHRLIGEDIELALDLEEELGTVRADAGQLEQVIANLVVNARDAMPAGGRLVIASRDVDVTPDHALADQEIPSGRYVTFSVGDSGAGMTAEVRRRLFEPFFTTKELGRGTGLGLSTCYGIVKQLGGYIACHSELGRGTTFRIYLPRIDAEVTVAVPPKRTLELAGTEGIVLVEDDPRVRASVERVLVGAGYAVTLATRASEVVEHVRRSGNQIALVISDIVMPGVTGPEIAALVREVAPHVRTLLMSGYTTHQAMPEEPISEIGAHYIQKPFAPNTLLRKVREVLDA